MTSIDTVYEYAGLKLAGTIHEVLGGVGLFLILGLAGTAHVVHQISSDRASVRELGVHFFGLILIFWLISPTREGEMEVPRFLSWLGRGADLLQQRAVRQVNERFLESPFEWERIAAMADFGTVLDPILGKDMNLFLEACAKPALAAAVPRGDNLFLEGVLAYGPGCEERRRNLWSRLREHVRTDPFHKEAVGAAGRRDPEEAAEFMERYADQVAVRFIDAPGAATGEMALVREALGEYAWFDSAQSTGGMPTALKSVSTPFFGAAAWMAGDAVVDGAISGAAQLHQAWGNRFTARQKYYLAVVYGPHVYGLSLLFLLGLFPVAGAFALLPGKWKALVNYGKVFVSVKLWPLCWAALTSFTARRSALEAFSPAERGGTDVALAVASMYLLTPAIAFLMVHLAATAAAMPFSPAVPPAAGPGLGPAAPVASAALRAAR